MRMSKKAIDKMPILTEKEVSENTGHMRNYFVTFGTVCASGTIAIHCGFGGNHLQTIKDLLKAEGNNLKIFQIRMDNRKWRRSEKLFSR